MKFFRKYWIWLTIGVAILVAIAFIIFSRKKGKGTSYLNQASLPPGLRNNNPGNIIRTKNSAWEGMVPVQDSRFVKFESIPHGIQAYYQLLRNQYLNEGKNTIRAILYKYAPPIENDTEKYISNVSQRTGFSPDQKLTFNKATMVPLAKAFFQSEIGPKYEKMIPAADYTTAWNLV